MERQILTADQKSLRLNLDGRFFGTFAEIGAGQEVARHFFRVGGAAGTIAKTISAYDMTFSDSIYGKVGRYVSKERLEGMLQHEYKLLLERLSVKRGAETNFFVFADTVSARNFKGTNECHGWLGVRFQTDPLKAPNDIVIHVRMTDRENLLQQQALGIIGVNLLYGALFDRDDPERFVSGLLDELSTDRIEVDMIEFSGPDCSEIDNRIMSLKLVQHNLTNAVLFAPDCNVLQPSEVLYKRPLLLERGSFRPVTHVNLDMMEGAKTPFLKCCKSVDKDPIILFEITLNNLLANGAFDAADFLARADTLSALGYTVLVSNYSEHYRLIEYFRRYTKEPIGLAIGINSLLQIFDPKFYESLGGNFLEAMGRLFGHNVKAYVYPMTNLGYEKYSKVPGSSSNHAENAVSGSARLLTAKELQVAPELNFLYQHLLACGSIEEITDFDEAHLSILSREVYGKIQSGDPSWESAVPAAAALVIKQRGMFGCRSKAISKPGQNGLNGQNGQKDTEIIEVDQQVEKASRPKLDKAAARAPHRA